MENMFMKFDHSFPPLRRDQVLLTYVGGEEGNRY